MVSNMLKLKINENLINDIQVGLLEGKDTIKLKNKSYADDIMLTYKICLSRNPEIVNVDYGKIGVISGVGNDYLKTNPKVVWDGVKGRNYIFTFEDSIRLGKYAEKISNELLLSKKDDMKKAVAIYDYLTKTVTYAETGNAHDAWGALIDKKAVCEGISYAFCLLAKKCGLNSTVVSGMLKGQPHAWNMVSVDGFPYHVDITSNLDSKNNNASNYDYIFLKDSDLKEYEWNRNVYPVCNSQHHNYFIMSHSYATNETEAINIISRQLNKHRIVYFRCSNDVILNEVLVQGLFIRACEKTNSSFSSLTILINQKLNTAQIFYK